MALFGGTPPSPNLSPKPPNTRYRPTNLFFAPTKPRLVFQSFPNKAFNAKLKIPKSGDGTTVGTNFAVLLPRPTATPPSVPLTPDLVPLPRLPEIADDDIPVPSDPKLASAAPVDPPVDVSADDDLTVALQGLTLKGRRKKGAVAPAKKVGSSDLNVDAAVKDPELWKTRVELLKITPVDAALEEEYKRAWHVYRDDGDDDWKIVLTKTEISSNKNSFYTMYLMEHNDSALYGLWVRWGRIGAPKGSTIFDEFEGDLRKAKKSFETKYATRTNQAWSDRKNFQPIAGFHTILHVVSTAAAQVDDSSVINKKLGNVCPSRLDQRVQDFVMMVCDIKTATKGVLAQNDYDSRGNPFGCLSSEHIKAGYRALQTIDDLLANGAIAAGDPDLLKANNEFYAAIPHNFGNSKPHVLMTAKAVRDKIKLLQVLGDINEAVDALGPLKNAWESDIDFKYLALDCEISLMDVNCPEYRVIRDYLQYSHGQTHRFHMEAIDMFCCHKQDQIDNFVDHGNRQLLWHGSRLSNWVGILKRGLLIAPSNVVHNGSMFGNGIYFADRVTKSGQYCLLDQDQTEAILVLCEVSLGNSQEMLNANHYLNAHNLPTGFQSVKGMGLYIPHTPAVPQSILDGVYVPSGVTVVNPTRCALHYNEYIVYNPNQVIMRYLVRARVTHT